MSRVAFPDGEQEVWVNELLNKANVSVEEAAGICGVSERTFRDWRRSKYTISEKAMLQLCKHFRVSAPLDTQRLPDFWYVEKGARKGAMRRMEIYGPPGDKESRRKGGLVSQQRRRENPEKYRLLGCNIRKQFPPFEKTALFAEMIGIILGDGGVTDSQLKITLGSKADREYAHYVSGICRNVFGESPSWYEYEEDNSIELCISGTGLIEELSGWGIGKGNKIKRQVNFPEWVWETAELQKACARGLMDTDGGVYFHHHLTKGIKYRNLGICFTSYSRPLLLSFSKVLEGNNIKHSIVGKGRIYIYDLEEVKKYFEIIGSNNLKHRQRLAYHLSHSRRLN